MNPLSKRQLLLSLKYCVIEGCFSVPMLNLTTGNLPFLIGFAVKVLGWQDTAIGFLAATPFICLFLQPPVAYWLQKRLSLYRIMLVMFVFNAVPWTLVAWFPSFGQNVHWVFPLIVMVSTLSNSVCGVVWSAAVSDLVPLSMRGRYFGTRNMMFGFWTLVVVLTAGQIADYFGNSIRAFGIIFSLAAAARMFGLYFLTRMKFPQSVMERRPQTSPYTALAGVFRDGNFVRLLVFTGLFGLCLNLGSPFYSVFILKELPLTIGDLTVMTTIATLGGLLSLRTWGKLSDRFGNKPVMLTCALTWLLTAIVSWLLSGPHRFHHLYANYFVTGFMMAGFQQIGQFNLMIKMVPPENKAHYISIYMSFTNMLIALGPVIGGIILQGLPAQVGTFLGHPVTRYHFLIVGSLALCVVLLHLLHSLEEPQERPLGELVKVMRQMREFNPVLGLLTVAEYMFTPQGLGRLAKHSLRTFRRQTSAVTDVGGELVESGWRTLREAARLTPKVQPAPVIEPTRTSVLPNRDTRPGSHSQ
jgi:MFS family permease